jgi:putative radical SAM enzyme (TIGR03279 family)
MPISISGLPIKHVFPRSPAYMAGLRKGDRILYVNDENVADGLELRFFCAQEESRIVFLRKNEIYETVLVRKPGRDTGMIPVDPPLRRCANRCLFCFIDQMRMGLRKSLYIKDEDYRYSFTDGNYITLSNDSEKTLAKIVRLGLSPLFISVHATTPEIRKELLGNKRAIDIMHQLDFLSRNGISFHAQIVICPGINDGKELEKTVRKLAGFKNSILSIALVPVGLTKYHKNGLAPVTKKNALEICRNADVWGSRRVVSGKARLIYCADELFIKAGLSIPRENYYEGYPQIENGVGLIRLLLEEWRDLKRKLSSNSFKNWNKSINKYLVLTSESAFGYINSIMNDIEKLMPGVIIDVAAVENCFLGRSVTVAGLLSAQDVIRTIKKRDEKYQRIFLPAVMFNIHGHTLDGYSVKRITKITGFKIAPVSSLGELIEHAGK